jgi:hypothetical protein
MAESLGYADGEATPVGEILDAIARITQAVDVPVTADMERGYGLPPAEFVERLAAAGAVGCNLEDSEPRTDAMIDADAQAEFLAAVRAAAVAAGCRPGHQRAHRCVHRRHWYARGTTRGRDRPAPAGIWPRRGLRLPHLRHRSGHRQRADRGVRRTGQRFC